MPESQFEMRHRVLNELRTLTGTMPKDNEADASGLEFDIDNFAFVSTQATTTTLDDDSIASSHQQQRRKSFFKS